MGIISNLTVGVCIPTFHAAGHLPALLSALMQCHVVSTTLVVDSSSKDATVEIARDHGVRVIIRPQSEFNHGATREFARNCLGTDIVVMMTQDVRPVTTDFIDKLIAPLLHGAASISYARQIPRSGASIMEAYPRDFNYPATSHLRSLDDVPDYGVYTFFCSNSCAAYLNKALDEIGGFPTTLTNEDYLAAARLLQRGHRIAYVAEAVVEHSHDYSLTEEFHRYFDTGYTRAENPWVTGIVGQAENRGREFLVGLMKELIFHKPWLIPYALINSLVKWAGYRVGFFFHNAPLSVKIALSGQKYYWKSKHYREGL